MDFLYLHEKLAAAVDVLMLPHGSGEVASIAAAFHEFNLGLMGVDTMRVADDNARSWLVELGEIMDTASLTEPARKGLYTVKAEMLSSEEQFRLSRVVRELEAWTAHQ